MPQIIRQIATSIIWIGGSDFQGLVKNVKLGDLESETDDDPRLGLVGSFATFTGFAKPEMSCAFSAWSDKWAKPFSNLINPFFVTFRGALANVDNADDVEDYVVTVGGTSQKVPLGGGTPQEVTEWEVGMNVRYIRQEVAGVQVLLYNSLTNEYSVMGKDILKPTRQALGLV